MMYSSEEYTRMAAVESRHWWFVSLHEQVLEALREYCPVADPQILDAGCGTGGLLRYLAAHGYKRASGFDLSDDAVHYCVDRQLDVYRRDLRTFADELAAASLDVIVSNDTLVYLDADARRHFVNECARLLRPGGLLIANAAALPAFRGIHDLAVGARFRLDRRMVHATLEGGPWLVRCIRYWPFLLSPVIYIVRLRQRLALRRNPAAVPRSDVDLPPGWLNRGLHTLVTLERRLEIPLPWGSSLFLVASRAGNSHGEAGEDS